MASLDTACPQWWHSICHFSKSVRQAGQESISEKENFSVWVRDLHVGRIETQLDFLLDYIQTSLQRHYQYISTIGGFNERSDFIGRVPHGSIHFHDNVSSSQSGYISRTTRNHVGHGYSDGMPGQGSRLLGVG